MKRRRLLVGLAVAVVAVAAIDQAAVSIGVHALIDAPNAGRAATQLVAPPPPPGVRVRRFEVTDPPASIAAWQLEPTAPPSGTAFVLHGIRDSKTPMIGLGRALAGAGLRTLLLDHRGQGASTGDVLSYGVFEAHDLSQIADQLAAGGEIAGPISALGFSYGAAVALEWSGRDPRVAAVVAVAPFSSLRSIMPNYAAKMVPGLGALIPGVLMDRTLRVAGERGGFDASLASPLAAVEQGSARLLLIHGRADSHIPFTESEAIARRAGSRAELLLVDGEDHGSILADRNGLVIRRAVEFLRGGVH